MVIMAGAMLLGAGTAGKFVAGRQRENAFNAALRQREEDVAGFNTERTDALQNFGEQMLPLSGQTAQNKVNALAGLSQAGNIGTAAAAQGSQDINQAAADVFGMSPVSDVFGAGTGAGAGVASRQQAMMQPGQDAFQALSAGGLGRMAQQQANEAVFRDNAFANIGVNNQFQNVQESNAFRTADIGLRDLESNLAFQAATQKAGQKGEMLNAFSGLAQQVGGGLISQGATVKPK